MNAKLVINGIECPISALTVNKGDVLLLRVGKATDLHTFEYASKEIVERTGASFCVALENGADLSSMDEEAMASMGWVKAEKAIARNSIGAIFQRAFNKYRPRSIFLHGNVHPQQVVRELANELIGKCEFEELT